MPPDRPSPGDVEQRSAAIQAPAPRVEGNRLHGVIPYAVESRDLGGWREKLAPGCLAGADLSDLVCTVGHDENRLLGRHPKTLSVEQRDDGLAWSCDLPNGPTGHDVREAVLRGDLRATSWRMVVAAGGDRWDGDVRVIERIAELRDVAICANPAYPAARAELRARPESNEQRQPMPDETTEARPGTDPAASNPAASNPTPVGGGGATTTTGGSGLTGQTTSSRSTLRVEDRTASTPTVEARVIEALRSVPRGEARSLTTTVCVSPGEVSTVLFDKVRASSVGLRSGFRVVTTTKDSVVWPSITADAVPAWYAEAAPIVPGDPTFSSVTATPRKLAHLIQLSNEVIEDSDPSIVQVLNDHLLKVLGLKLDAGLFSGTGTAPEIRGLRNVAGSQTVDHGGANGAALANLDPIADALGLLEAASTTATAIVCAPRTFGALRKLKTAPTGSNEHLLSESPSADLQPRIFGVPVYVSGQLAVNETQGTSSDASSIYVYNAAEIVYVRRTEIELELDRSRLFNSDQSELRARMRGDLIVPNPSAVVRVAGIRP